MDTASIKQYASSTAPWRRGAPWWLVMAEGAILIAVGIYALVASDSARETIFAVFGIILAGNGFAGAADAFRSEPSRRTSYQAFRGGIGLSLGLLALFARFSDNFESEAARLILAFGYLAVGIVSLIRHVIVRKEQKFPLGSIAFDLALIVMAIVFFTSDSTDSSRIELIGWIAIVVGLLLGAFGFYLRSKGSALSGDDLYGAQASSSAAASTAASEPVAASKASADSVATEAAAEAKPVIDAVDDANL